MVKPGGTGRPRLAISASPAPLPPRMSRMAAEPSARPLPKKYTHRSRDGTGGGALRRKRELKARGVPVTGQLIRAGRREGPAKAGGQEAPRIVAHGGGNTPTVRIPEQSPA